MFNSHQADDRQSPNGSTRPRVLVVDDAPALVMLMTKTLQAAGFAVANASTGTEAIAEARRFAPDLVLLDIGLPEMDGISACQAIRRESADSALPIIMVTGSDDSETIDRARAAGATDFVFKPIEWPKFETLIRRFLAVASAERQSAAIGELNT